MSPPDLLSADLKRFEAALLQLPKEFVNEDDFASFIVIIDSFNQENSLGAREQGRRVELLLAHCRLSESQLASLVENAARWSANVKNAIHRRLPPELRPAIYKKITAVSNERSEVPQPLPQFDDSGPTKLESLSADSEFRTVLLLGAADKHESNHALLQSKGFVPIRVPTLDRLEDSLKISICGIIVDGSWWTLLPPANHEQEVTRLLLFSTLIWLKIDVSTVSSDVAAKLPAICNRCRFKDPSIRELSYGASCQLTTADIPSLEDAVQNLTAGENGRFHPAEINESEGRVLLAAIKKQVKGRHLFEDQMQIERVDTSIVHGGRSMAKVVIVKPDDGGSPFVAKIDAFDRLSEELKRFKVFVEPWQRDLHPELHVYGSIAVILLSLIDDIDRSNSPAPTLHQRISDFCSLDRGAVLSSPPTLAALEAAVIATINKLKALNLRPNISKGIVDYCWLGLEPLDKLAESGILFILEFRGKRLDVMALGIKATKVLLELKGKATVHGDAHLRNVLIRNDVEPLLIDFAYSGPGHPAFDLVRFESAMTFSHFRMTAEEDQLAECFIDAYVKGHDFSNLTRLHPEVFSSQINVLAMKTAIASRSAVLEVLQKYGRGVEQYYAMKYVIAAQSLTIPELQTGVVRAAIKALAGAV